MLGGERYLFGVIDLDSDFSDVTRIKSKTEVPDCIAQFIAFATSVGVTILRMHTDNEAIFHTTQAHDATKSRFRAQGVMMITTGSEYASRQNSKIERLWRTIAGDGRASLLAAPELDDAYYIFAVIDANGKRLVLPYADDRTSCRWRAFTGKVPSAAVFRVFRSLAYVTLDHELNQSAAKLQKAGERATPGILLCYGRDGTVFDRRWPGWVVHVPQYHLNKPIITPHVTVLEHIRPSPKLLRQLSFTRPDEIDRTPVSLRVSEDGDVEQAQAHTTSGAFEDTDSGFETPPPAASVVTRHASLPAPTPVTIAHRLSRASTGPHGRQSDDVGAGSMSLTSSAATAMPAVPAVAAAAVVSGSAVAGAPPNADRAHAPMVWYPLGSGRATVQWLGSQSSVECSPTRPSTLRALWMSTTTTSTGSGCRIRSGSSHTRGRHPARARPTPTTSLAPSLAPRLMAAPSTAATPMESQSYSTSAWQTARYRCADQCPVVFQRAWSGTHGATCHTNSRRDTTTRSCFRLR